MEKIKCTPEMMDFWGELQEQQDGINKENNKNSAKRKKLEQRIGTIADAVIGYGTALNALAEEKEKIEKEISGITHIYNDLDLKFKSRFGVSYYSLEFSGFTREEEEKVEPMETDN